MPFVMCQCRWLRQKLQPILKVDPRDRIPGSTGNVTNASSPSARNIPRRSRAALFVMAAAEKRKLNSGQRGLSTSNSDSALKPE